MNTTYFRFTHKTIFALSLLLPGYAHASPYINNITGNIANDTTITINGSGFTKKLNAKPLFWWRADFGATPSNLGRKTTWDSVFHGEISTAIVAPGSKQSMRWDLGKSEGAALAKIQFGINKSQIFLYRKIYEGFDVTKDFAIRTREKNQTCPPRGTVGILKPGNVIRGVTSGATGVVSEFFQEGSHCAIFYNNKMGTINASPHVDFIYGETMIGPAGITMVNDEGTPVYPTGTFRTFNDKAIRFWNMTQQNNIYFGAQGANNNKYNILRENTDATLWNKNFTNKLVQLPFQWVTEEIKYRASSAINISDAVFDYYQNGVLASDQTYISRTTARPDPYSSVYQHQVSNGAQPGSNVYYDELYLDDTWQHVVICRAHKWASCKHPQIQIPSAWKDTQITVQLNMGGLNRDSSLFLYVIDKNGNANINGYPLCEKCPRQLIPQ